MNPDPWVGYDDDGQPDDVYPAAVMPPDADCVMCGAPAVGIGMRSGDPLCTACRRDDRREWQRDQLEARSDQWAEQLGVTL